MEVNHKTEIRIANSADHLISSSIFTCAPGAQI